MFDWKRWPETEAFVDELIATALAGNAFAAEPGGADAAARPGRGSRTGSITWWFAADPALADRLEALGYERQRSTYAVGVPVFAHPGGIFPRIALGAG